MKNIFIIITLLLIYANTTYADTSYIDSTENSSVNVIAKEIKKELNLGDYYKNNNNVIKAYEVYNTALLKSQKLDNKNLMYISYTRLGLLYERIGNYKLSAENQIKALNIADNLSDNWKKARSYNYLGNIFILEKDYTQAYDYFIKSAKIDQELKNDKGIAGTYNNIGEVYRYQEQYDKALKYYKKAIPINRRMRNNQWLAINYENIGSVYFKRGDNKEALRYFSLALNHAKIINDYEGLSSIYNNIGELYLNQNKNDLALKYLTLAYKYASKISATLFIKNSAFNLSKAYSIKENYKKAYQYFKIYQEAETKLNENLRTKRISQIVAEYQLDRKEKENEYLKKKNEFDRLKQYALILIIILIFVIGLLMFTRLRTKQKKTQELLEQNKLIIKTEKTLAEIELKNIELEKEKLSQELNYQKKELVNFALHIIHKNDFLISVKNELKKIRTNDVKTGKQIRELLLKINQSQKINADLEEFQQNVERANKDFLDALNNNFPDLTKNEKRLAALLRIDLSSKEIASLSNISIKAVEMGRYRLRKKLDLGTNESLTDFFQEITSNK